MRLIRTVAELREWRADAGIVGLVPTMGALHAGHRSLAERAVSENDVAVASIFVNPTQFGPNEDYRSYPRSEEADLAMLEELAVGAAFIPSLEEMYPPGDATRVMPGPIAECLEGAARPGHFVGVATVVAKLFGMARPDRAYFGQKDFQQLRVIQSLVRDLALGIEIVPCHTVREPDGLALASRNAYLSADERERALAIPRGLFGARELWEAGTRDAASLRAAVRDVASAAGSLDYVSAADPITLEELDGHAESAVISLAARVGRARLIDNVLLGIRLEDIDRAHQP